MDSCQTNFSVPIVLKESLSGKTSTAVEGVLLSLFTSKSFSLLSSPDRFGFPSSIAIIFIRYLGEFGNNTVFQT